MNRIKRFSAFAVCLFCFISVFAQEKVAEKMQYKEKNANLSLYPNTEMGSKVPMLWDNFNKNKPIFISENLFEYPAKENAMEIVSKILRSFSTMEGLEYFSNSNGRKIFS